ncbi:antitoxin [Phormidium tenue]|uniref:Antitoxin n=1 Tax=Phormidium tenue NIES-30 TaxID=549789 RepID=A0A1U7IYJ6_9CYAN|nr:antitoxin [Phormidium tenue]MBD2232759.1 antitoxin [Phormidium tenue FACHB-1052]OKH43696.1 antitoxin [Phormidium tenue NIES-30]
MNNLDSEEQEILDAFETGRLQQSATVAEELKLHQAIAAATFKKDARINIRLSSKDLRALQARAFKEGIPYQTLVASILHKFVDGQLIEKPTSK